MAELMEYKCPCCGARLTFSSALQRMKCEYCDSEFDVETLKAYDEALKEAEERPPEVETSEGAEWRDDEASGLRIYSCQSCGGEVVGDETLAASSCPFCGNPVIMKAQFAGDLKPDLVIPFKLDKEAAKKGFEKHLRGKRLLPKVFRTENHIDEIKGVYVPFWLYDTNASGTAEFRGTTVRTWMDSRFNYTETKYYSVLRSAAMSFENIPADGSKKMDDALMDSLEPFNMAEAVDFQTAYLAGYFADRYDVSIEESAPRADERAANTIISMLENTVTGYTSKTIESQNVHLRRGKAHYALLPVWLLSTKWNGKNFLFAMNAQTGKMVGDLPMSWGKFWLTFAGIFAPLAALCYWFFYL